MIEVRFILDGRVSGHGADELPGLLARDDGLVWVDVPTCDAEASRVLADAFGFHPLALRDAAVRNRVPKIHPYADHVFVVLHAPHLGSRGHVHYVELDQFIGPRYLVTVHGPANPAVPPDIPVKQTRDVLRRIEAGRFAPASAYELSYAIVSAITRLQENLVEGITADVWRLEQRVTAGHLGNPEQFLEELFQARHGLLAVRTMAALGGEIYGRLAGLTRVVPPEAAASLADVIDQFARVRSVADGEREYLQGVIEFYQARTETKMTIAAERLAVIAAVTLPITALSSVYGMNLIVNEKTQGLHVVAVLVIMAVMSGTLLTWAKRQGWW
ncbi:magnesium transporter CorA family protein [Dactylosporangium sp. AC04546]|uniref:magnesium transporter CorA family protein n=1 Tax=Dactylosporangium sp. AC04546 TaxID=2862460 RepID=UPI001EDF433A|nr:magnesium transporter CorA family protein [Dactylosporangium sp. AC04546]WVK80008.1 magnesium transporter CorA family protein [Dactylosporangium sp. AC04546]